MASKDIFSILFFIFLHCVVCGSAQATFIIHSQSDVVVELKGFNGLTDTVLFKGKVTAGGKCQVGTPYRGLGLLVFEGGQSYPVLINDEPFTLKITTPVELPSFIGSEENRFFYKVLSGGDQGSGLYNFARLMIQAKQLLKSTHSIKTVTEMNAKKKEFHEFMGKHYKSLKHSDLVKRLIAQYFMMHEYVNYHIEGEPATNIRARYVAEILAGVGKWINILKSYIPKNEVLNYITGLYYNRSMVSLASYLIDNFRDISFCPGEEEITVTFPESLQLITTVKGQWETQLQHIKGEKIIAFVSEQCPVSMVETVIKARQSAEQQKGVAVIVAPLEELSANHLAMTNMISNGVLFFINDEQWRKENLPSKMKLPRFVQIEAEQAVEVAQ